MIKKGLKQFEEDAEKAANRGKSKHISEIIFKKLDGIAVDLKEIKANQKVLLAHTQGVNSQIKKCDFIAAHQLEIPFKDLTKFKLFDRQLLYKEFKDDYEASLLFYFDRELNIRRSSSNILKKFLHKSLVIQFTASRKSKRGEEESFFDETQMSKNMLDILRNTHIDYITKQEVTEKYFVRELVIAISGAKDWDGGRKARENIDKEKTEERGNDHDEKVNYYLGVPAEMITLKIPGCEILCPLEQFSTLTQNVIPSGRDLACNNVRSALGSDHLAKAASYTVGKLKYLFSG